MKKTECPFCECVEFLPKSSIYRILAVIAEEEEKYDKAMAETYVMPQNDKDCEDCEDYDIEAEMMSIING